MKAAQRLFVFLSSSFLLLFISSRAYADMTVQSVSRTGSAWIWGFTVFIAVLAVVSLLPRRRKKEKQVEKRNG